ncbi:MAG: hypothetical protein M1482_01580 [Chloroflexi bacterium]|nr:hypothetical protein [Chloroflexota bacterium]
MTLDYPYRPTKTIYPTVTSIATAVAHSTADRLSQTVGVTATRYALDPAAGLTQVLSDGTNTYLCGAGALRVAQY